MIKTTQKTQNQEWKYMTREDRAKELIKVYDIVNKAVITPTFKYFNHSYYSW